MNYIASIESSASKFPKPETIDAIAAALHIPASQLFMETGCPVNAVSFSREDFTEQVIDDLHMLLKADLEKYLDTKI